MIKVKKGPNGKDYEYEYVYYYYYDEEEETDRENDSMLEPLTEVNANTSRQNYHNREKFSMLKHSTSLLANTTTVQPVINEVVSDTVKGRQTDTEQEKVIEERLPINTRFPHR